MTYHPKLQWQTVWTPAGLAFRYDVAEVVVAPTPQANGLGDIWTVVVEGRTVNRSRSLDRAFSSAEKYVREQLDGLWLEHLERMPKVSVLDVVKAPRHG